MFQTTNQLCDFHLSVLRLRLGSTLKNPGLTRALQNGLGLSKMIGAMNHGSTDFVHWVATMKHRVKQWRFYFLGLPNQNDNGASISL